MHAGMWLIPAVGLLVYDGRGRRGVLAGAAVIALTAVLVPHPPDPTSGPWVIRIWHEALVACYLLLIAALPLRRHPPDTARVTSDSSYAAGIGSIGSTTDNGSAGATAV